jgi:hypothetical protein
VTIAGTAAYAGYPGLPAMVERAVAAARRLRASEVRVTPCASTILATFLG